jgi:hypothetical protein
MKVSIRLPIATASCSGIVEVVLLGRKRGIRGEKGD